MANQFEKVRPIWTEDTHITRVAPRLANWFEKDGLKTHTHITRVAQRPLPPHGVTDTHHQSGTKASASPWCH
ncbi:hypothetical protein ACOMHN_007904 [Nucella lapillus]